MNALYTVLVWLPLLSGLAAVVSLAMYAINRKKPNSRIALKIACGALGVMALVFLLLFLCGVMGIGPVPE